EGARSWVLGFGGTSYGQSRRHGDSVDVTCRGVSSDRAGPLCRPHTVAFFALQAAAPSRCTAPHLV
ncbi:MAG: hypothetical protein AVDCRST_MAG93-580, partial [uncultured Chloroflexia bacterium]